MLGPPGAGKGTQAERISRTRQLPKISTGDILREAVHDKTPLGCAATESMEAGRLVSDDVMIGIVQERLDRPDARNGFVLDGFPRTIVQADALDRMVGGRGPLVVLDIVVPEDVLVRRLASRRRPGGAGGRRRRDRAGASRGLPSADQAAGRLLQGAADVPSDRRQPAARHRDRGD
jgi:adenylate kinase